MSAANFAATNAAAAAAIAQATKASGVIVRLEPQEFMAILARSEAPVVVSVTSKAWFTPAYQYLTSYRGLAFYTKSDTAIDLPRGCEVVQCKSIYIPG